MIQKRGKNAWVVRVYNPVLQAKEWVGTYPDRESAKAAHRKAEERFSKRSRSRAKITVTEWSERWLESFHGPGTRRPESTTYTHDRDAIKPFVAEHGARRLADITPDVARDHISEFTWRAKVVAAMFNDAVRDAKLDDTPFKGLSHKPGPGREDIDPLTAEEVARLAEIALERHDFYGPHFAAVILTLAWTGVRPGELGGWEWHDFDLAAGEARVRRQARRDKVVPYTKTKLNRTIVLAPQVVEQIAGLPRMREYVFATRTGARLRPGNVGYFWRPVRDAFAAELPADHWLPRRLAENPRDKLVPYECRHFCGSWLAAQGLNEFEIAEHLGNTPEVCRRVYIHAYRSEIRDKVRAAFAAGHGSYGVHGGAQNLRDAR